MCPFIRFIRSSSCIINGDCVLDIHFVLAGAHILFYTRVFIWFCLLFLWKVRRYRGVVSATFNNISVISWRSVLLVEETGVPGENHWPATSHWQTFYYIMLYTSRWEGVEPTTSVVISTDCIGSCKSNYHTITATTAPFGGDRILDSSAIFNFYFVAPYLIICTVDIVP